MNPSAPNRIPLALIAFICAAPFMACDASLPSLDAGLEDGDVPDSSAPCLPGELGCECRSSDEDPGSSADDACDQGSCISGVCVDCDDAEGSAEPCKAPLSCSDLRALGMCGEYERCEEKIGADAKCLPGECIEGTRWSETASRCIACISEGCEEEPSCDPDDPNRLDCGPHRLCEIRGDAAECGECEEGYIDVGGQCAEAERCGGALCTESEYCDRSDEDAPRCAPRPCADPSMALGSDGLCSVRCDEPCDLPGATGRLWPFATNDDRCACETLPGYFLSAQTKPGETHDLVPRKCDADRDGWVREEVREIHDAPVSDEALIANARCVIREALSIKLIDEYGHSSLIDSCEEGLLQDRITDEGEPNEGCTPLPIRLFESERNDVDGEAERLNEAGPYEAGGRRFRASELNSLTKACVSELGDYDDDGVADLLQVQPRPEESASLNEEARLRAFAHFIELYQTEWERGASPSGGGILIIRERSRCGSFPLGYGDDGAYESTNPASYWRNCERRRHPGFDAESGSPGFDFAQFSCESRSGSCPPPAMPAHPTEATLADPSIALLRGHGLCELGGARPADGVWRGMGHHSQFQCVRVVSDGEESAPYERELAAFLNEGKLSFNECRVIDCEGAEGCSDSSAPAEAPGAHDPRLHCTRASGDELPSLGRVGFAALRYQPYGHLDPAGNLVGEAEYQGGCINEDAEYPALCPPPEFSRCDEAETDAFGRYRCHGWESLFLWADDDGSISRAELVWAPEEGEAINMSIFNPASAPVCL